MDLRFLILLSLGLLCGGQEGGSDNARPTKGDKLTSDAFTCMKLELYGSELHPSTNGVYVQNPEPYNEMPNFAMVENGKKTRFMWWVDHTTYTRWYVGTNLGSQSVEGFRDSSGKNDVHLFQSNANVWNLVHDREWRQEPSVGIRCLESMSKPVNPAPPKVENVVLINTSNERIRQVYKHISGSYTYDRPAYVSDTGVFLYYKEYPNYQRWYIGLEVDTDHKVYAFTDVVKMPDQKDPVLHTAGTVWSERQANEWIVNKELRLVKETDPLARQALAKNVKETTTCPFYGVGSADQDLNQVFNALPGQKINSRPVYVSVRGEHVWSRAGESSSWVVGFPGQMPGDDGDIQAVVYGEWPTIDEIPAGTDWFLWDEEKQIFLDEKNYLVMCSNCKVTVAGANNGMANGQWEVDTTQTHAGRPVFKRGKQWMYFMSHRDFGRWYITNEDGKVGSASNVIAFVNTDARSPEHIDVYSIWSERGAPKKGRFAQNAKLKITGTCVKGGKGHGWENVKTEGSEIVDKSGQLTEESEAVGPDGCPNDLTYRTVKDQDYAIVHWRDPTKDLPGHEIFYSSAGASPGSKFKVGETGVVYSVRSNGRTIRTCDFVVSVLDLDPPIVECHKDIFTKTDPGKGNALVTWPEPTAIDAVDGSQILINQVTGPKSGSKINKGHHRVSYTIKDQSGNIARCEFRVKVQDLEPPTVVGCPRDIVIPVYESNDWTAHPKWAVPRGRDNVDGNRVKVELVAGVNPGSPFQLAPDQEKNVVAQIYHLTDKSGNVATCQFQVSLEKAKEKTGTDYQEDLPTGEPQEPEKPRDAQSARAAHWDKKRRKIEESRVEQVRKMREEREKMQDRRGSHRASKHAQKLNNMGEYSNDPRQFKEESSMWWTLTKYTLLMLILSAICGFGMWFGGCFESKGKRIAKKPTFISDTISKTTSAFTRAEPQGRKRHRI